MRKTNRGTYMWKNIVVWKRKGSFKGDFIIRGSVDTWTNWIAKELLPTERKPMRATLRCLVWAIFLFLLSLSRVSFPNQIFCKGKEIFLTDLFFHCFSLVLICDCRLWQTNFLWNVFLTHEKVAAQQKPPRVCSGAGNKDERLEYYCTFATF